MNDKLQQLLSAIKYVKASIDLIDSPEQRSHLLGLAMENEGIITLKNANTYFQGFVQLNDDIQSDSWKGVFNLKKNKNQCKHFSWTS